MDYEYFKEILQGVCHSESKVYPSEVDKVLEETASSGIVRFSWNLLKPLLKTRLKKVVDTEFEGQGYTNDEGLFERLLDRLDKFEDPPFTIQRVCELIIEPRKQYKKIGAYLRAIERNLLVVSTQEPDLTWMKSPRLTQLLEEPVNGTSQEKITNSNSNEQNSLYNNKQVSVQDCDSTPEDTSHHDNSTSHSGPRTDTSEWNGQDQEMDFESSITRLNRKRKSCDREDNQNPPEETRTVLQEADSTTAPETEETPMDIAVNTDIEAGTVAKRLKPSTAEISSQEVPIEGAQGDGLVSSAAPGKLVHVKNTVQSESSGGN